MVHVFLASITHDYTMLTYTEPLNDQPKKPLKVMIPTDDLPSSASQPLSAPSLSMPSSSEPSRRNSLQAIWSHLDPLSLPTRSSLFFQDDDIDSILKPNSVHIFF